MPEFLSISSAFGLSSAAGLNAYIPLLLISIATNRGIIHLAPPYDTLGAWWAVAILVILCIAELVVDKIPGADHANDVLQTILRPAAGAILFASQAGVIHHVHPAFWLIIGLLMAGSVHAAKASARPIINVSTFGIGGPIVSAIENMVATVLAIVAIIAPILCLILMAMFAWVLYKAFKRFRAKPIKVAAVPVP